MVCFRISVISVCIIVSLFLLNDTPNGVELLGGVQPQHQPLDLRFFKVHGNTFSQEQAGALARRADRVQPGAIEHLTAQLEHLTKV